jgi:bifunctional DNA-binding transcriptional regulator/antitoxin component of YhaV-PrlF toxin-antitoxin module
MTQTLVKIEDQGLLKLPDEIWQRLGLKTGDLVSVIETADGVLISPRAAIVAQALDGIGHELHDAEVTLEDLIESGRAERGSILQDWHGSTPGPSTD